ncbi:Ig-like domain repeat protein [Nocardioides sp. zg-1228]|uniref:Ig-like domain repeat protein n=1 Tax=Nocardioides sp. zg-1228 TaxID=2763008 RepID=UPI001642383B|nr:Ig-like domain repeat protein [Nocardioides sp. zg-1228]MBC2933771.1 Ig-like domain repeat protein [Nocardioides sp. zg-1228]QSF58546.1 Ig-like domain repeat protein [Nocardioides sp. zg-1228]
MKHAHSGTRRSVGSIASLALLAGGIAVLASPAPAQAATTTIDHAELRWDLNQESTGGAFAPGTWNLFSAGRLHDPGAGSQTLTVSDRGATWTNGRPAGWSASEGNVTIEDKQADGSYAPTTWQGTRTNAAGQTVNAGATLSENVVSFANGTGTVDPATDTGTISWDGDFTVVYYSGMSFFHVSDPELSVTDGNGTLTATLSGYGSQMGDQSQWSALPATEVTLADLTGVDLTTSGLTVTPDYLGVTVDTAPGTTPQSTADPTTSGSFPQSFIDFQEAVGTASYWYSSGGSVDARKVATPLSVAWAPRVTVTRTTLLPTGEQEVTVEGTGFDPALATGTRPPLAGKPGGAYIAFGRYADVWRPSAGAPSTARVNQGGAGLRWAVRAEDVAALGSQASSAVVLDPDGSFTATLVVDKAAMDAAATSGNYGIYTYPGSGATQALYETFTPIRFADSAATVEVDAPAVVFGDDQLVTVDVTGSGSGTVTLREGEAVLGRASLDSGAAVLRLRRPGAGARHLSVTYSGDPATAGATTTTTATVAKAVPAMTVRAQGATAPEPVSVSVALPAAATGVVSLAEGATALGSADIVGGTAELAVGGLAVGPHTLTATYAGDRNHEAGTATTTVTVTAPAPAPVPAPVPTPTPTPVPQPGTLGGPAKGIATLTWGSRPRAGKRGTAVVTVSELATGRATVLVRTAKGKRVASLKVRIKAGTVRARLPKLPAGRYSLVAKVPGNDAVGKAKVTRTFRVK